MFFPAIQQSILGTGIEFAGYSWQITDEGTLTKCSTPDGKGCATAGGSFSIEPDGVHIDSVSSSGEYKGAGMPAVNSKVCMITEERINDIDEFLIILEGRGDSSTASGCGSCSPCS